MMTMKRVILVIFVIICGIIPLIYFKGSKIPKVRTIKPTISKIESSILTTGTVEPQSQTIICAKAKGVVDKVLVDENERVEVGQEIIIFDGEDALKRLENAQFELKQAKIDLLAAESLFVKKMGLYGRQEVSKEEVEEDKSLYKRALLEKNMAEEEVKLATEHLNNLVYLAPQSGVVIDRKVLPQQYVLANEVLMKIVNLDNLQVAVNLSRIDVKRIKLGQDAFIKAENLDKELTGYVKYVEPEEEEQNRLFSKIIIELDPSKELPEIKERVEVRIILERKKDVLLLNSDAIFKQGLQSFVYLYKNSRAVKRVVRVGITNRNQTEIIFGISAKDKIILPGKLKLTDGMKVKG
ncbi:MAG: efflux RND transporter periplasmic adaptor subunit [bacterium]